MCEQTCTSKESKKREQKLINKPWITPHILKKIKHRNDIFVRKKNKPEDEHLKKTYKRFRNSANKDMGNSKKYYYSSYFEACQSNMKKTWKGMRLFHYDLTPLLS